MQERGKREGRVGVRKGIRKETAGKKGKDREADGIRDRARDRRGRKTDSGSSCCRGGTMRPDSLWHGWARGSHSSLLAKGRQILPVDVQGVLSFLRLHASPVHGSREQHRKVTHSGPHSQDLIPLSQPPNPVLIPLPRPWASCHHFRFFPAFGGRFCDERE